MLGDLRLAVRGLRKQPGFSIAAILALALGIGSNTAIFSVIHGVLLAPLPYPSPDRLVTIWERQPTMDRCSISAPDLRDWKNQTKSFEGMAAFVHDRFSVSAPAGPQHLAGVLTSPDFFSVLGAPAQSGRTYAPSDAQGCVAVISSRVAPRLGEGTPIVGRSVTIDQRPCTIVGVVAAENAFPNRNDLWVRSEKELPTMRGAPADVLEQRGNHYLQAFGRLRPGVSVEQARQEIALVSDRISSADPDEIGHRAQLAPMQDDLVRNIRPTLWALLGSVLFVLLVASANVASLQLARATIREHELVTRAALGATRGRLLRQLLVENVVLALVGAGTGLLVAVWGIDGLVALSRSQLPTTRNIGIDVPVLAFTVGVAVVTGLCFGIIPALHASSAPAGQVLHGHGRFTAGRGRARRLLVATEIALALALATGAGVLVRSFAALSSVEPGFQSDRVATLPITAPPSKLGDDAALIAYYEDLLRQVAAAPGVDRAGLIMNVPMGGSNTNGDFMIDGRPKPGPNDRWVTEEQVVTPGYFATVGIPLLRGRGFDARDRMGAQKVILINQAFAKRFFPNDNPVGKRVSFDTGEPKWLEIVGVVGDVHQLSLIQPVLPEAYSPLAQFPASWMSIVVHGAPGFENAVRRAVASYDPDQPVEEMQPLERIVARSLAQRRFAMLLWSVFAGIALVLVLVGVYGVMSYTVAQRTREIGIRMALGADARSVVALVLREGVQVAVAGIAAGALGAFAVSRVVAQFVYGVSPMDPLTMIVVAALVVLVALVACAVPAWRGTRVDPMAALRSE